MSEKITVTNHAIDKWIQRVDINCSSKAARERIKTLFPYTIPGKETNNAVFRRIGRKINGKHVYLVTSKGDRNMVLTVVATTKLKKAKHEQR
jgi:hypothetical protein